MQITNTQKVRGFSKACGVNFHYKFYISGTQAPDCCIFSGDCSRLYTIRIFAVDYRLRTFSVNPNFWRRLIQSICRRGHRRCRVQRKTWTNHRRRKVCASHCSLFGFELLIDSLIDSTLLNPLDNLTLKIVTQLYIYFL